MTIANLRAKDFVNTSIYDKKQAMKKHDNRNYWSNQYSHKYAKAHYGKKCPKNIKELVLAEANALAKMWEGRLTVEHIAKELGVLHKFVHNVFQELQREGVIRQAREVNFGHARNTVFSNKDKKQTHTLPLAYIADAMHDGARHPKLYHLVKSAA